MKNSQFLFWIILAGFAFASFIPHLFPDFWLTDIFSHFKLQYAILLLLLLVPAVLLVKKNLLFLVSVLILLGWNSWFVIPLYLKGPEIKEDSAESFSILAMNLLASNTDYSKALRLIREKDPDLVVLLELSPEWERQMEVLNPEFPYREMFARRDNFGIGIMSKIPLEAQVTDFGRGFPPSIYCRLQINGRPVSLLATHPVPPVSQQKFELRNEQLEEIARLSKSQEGNFILAGDLNTSSYSKHFRDLLNDGDLKDSRKGFGIATTWPTDFYLLRTTLDHFLLKGELQVLKRTTEINIGSDHLPIFLRVGF